ncbi:hypothetical protein C8N32_11745 [Rhodovulum imhoffii]|uniref:Uncharacterized protein n=1 Tax=Rhodovulum imhoffii TaxID=365340 RepID=A0A2T5BPW8_9RHOB|nr:hypothetical protein [Rhodovulum imhoffii]MBK5934181.1 hypothetical protein [Rhodovulum imhoffii]PTN01097.1 hypothetical protein C8N32_11745 [Rhodovulum imhoffii]
MADHINRQGLRASGLYQNAASRDQIRAHIESVLRSGLVAERVQQGLARGAVGRGGIRHTTPRGRSPWARDQRSTG